MPRVGRERDAFVARGCAAASAASHASWDLPSQLVHGTEPAPAAGNRGLPLSSAAARQAPSGY